MLKAVRFLLSCFLLLLHTSLFAQQPLIRYQQDNGFPAHNAYYMLQDKAGYIWIGTENGLTRFNGYEFKLFTTRDGLPDNEILEMMEDDSGRLWFLPFSNTIGYIKNGLIHNKDNDPLLKQLHFDAKPQSVLYDRYGNTMIAEPARVTCITRTGQIKSVPFKSSQTHHSIFIFKTGNGCIQLLDTAHTLFQYNNEKWEKIAQLPCIDLKVCRFVINALGLDSAMTFFGKISKRKEAVYFDRAELDKIHFIVPLYPGKLAMLRTDGCFLIDIASTRITDTLLYGHSVSGCIIAADSSLWLCTHGRGIFRFIQSPVRSLELPAGPSSVTYIRGAQESMYATFGKGRYISAQISKEGALTRQILKELQPVELFKYLGKTPAGGWIGCTERLYAFSSIGQKAQPKPSIMVIKDVLEEDSAHLLIATAFHLHRFDRSKLETSEVLINKRLTSVARSGNKIYVGTLEGLLVNDSMGHFRKVFSANPAINTHLLKLCGAADNIVWIANNKGELLGIQEERVIAQLDQKAGLQCNRISAIKVSGEFIWAGTDNGLYAIQNTPPYRIVRHLTKATGLHTDEITSLDICNKFVWAGTTGGINYFKEQDIFKQSIQAKLTIHRIDNGGKTLQEQTNATIELSDKALAIYFDVVDQEGGQRPSYQYCTSNDSNWINLESNTLYFAKAPYGHFDVHIRANSPNWKQAASRTLHFYQPYPVYLRWWFITLVLLALAAAVLAGVTVYLRSVRKKDEEKVAVQRKLLQLEQMALQGQMNPHFIFNCIAAIKQYYSSGDYARANEFVDRFSGLIRQTFEMGAQLFISLDKELHYLAQYLAIEQTRFDHSFDFSIRKDLSLPESSIYVPVMLLQPLAENAVRHGIRHLTDRKGKIGINIVQEGQLVTISVTDNGVGRTKSKNFSQFLQNTVPLTSTTVNRKRIELLNQLLGQKIAYHTEDIMDGQGNTVGTKVTIAYPLSIHHTQN